MTLTCPECGGQMRLKNSKYGKFSGCENYPQCQATHGAHPDGRPLGIPANQETKQWRINAHKAFDKLWKCKKGITRKQAYAWLQEKMNLTSDEAHIGKFNIKQCKQLISLIKKMRTKQKAQSENN